MPLQATSGAASYDGFGGGVAAVPKYIEDYFSTFLYSGTGSAQTITNNIDLSGKGGLTWIKTRGTDTNYSHILTDTVRGATKALTSNTTDAEVTSSALLSAFTSTGFSVGTGVTVNKSGNTLVSWSLAKAPKFFDVVTYTGDGVAGRTVAHSLGSVPGCIIVKEYSNAGNNWQVYHRSIGNTKYLRLNTTAAETVSSTRWNNTDPTDTVFTLGTDSGVNANGASFVAYVFAHDAGGFGLTGTDNVISCGSYTGTGSTSLNVNLGYEPQWVMIKNSTTNASATGWYIQDNMRGMTASTDNNGVLYANLSSAEAQKGSHIVPTATGFTCSASDSDFNGSGTTYIYIAIRRGPMKVPTDATKVFTPVTYTGTGADITISSSNVVDLAITMARTSGGFSAWDKFASTRLTGNTFLSTNLTDAEASGGNVKVWNTTQDSLTLNQNYASYATNFTYVTELFKRAPSFFDEVCMTLPTSAATFNHNLGVVPELMIVRGRNQVSDWSVYAQAVSGLNGYMTLNSNAANQPFSGFWGTVAQTSTTFSVNGLYLVNTAGPAVAYLFATCPGVSKVGSYTGTGTTLQVNCGFTGGARFVLIKRTDSTGDWYVWDSARGIVSGNDPYLLLNSTAAEVTTTDYVDTYSAGFEISSTAPAAINASGGTFIFLAIA